MILLHQKADENIQDTDSHGGQVEAKTPTTTNNNIFSPEMTLGRLHEYNNLAAYFSSHAAALASGASPTSNSAMSGFLQHGSFLQKAHNPLPSPFFLPTGKTKKFGCIKFLKNKSEFDFTSFFSTRNTFFIAIFIGIWEAMSKKKSPNGIF